MKGGTMNERVESNLGVMHKQLPYVETIACAWLLHELLFQLREKCPPPPASPPSAPSLLSSKLFWATKFFYIEFLGKWSKKKETKYIEWKYSFPSNPMESVLNGLVWCNANAHHNTKVNFIAIFIQWIHSLIQSVRSQSLSYTMFIQLAMDEATFCFDKHFNLW